MSLLERLGRGHLSDATFARLWADESTGTEGRLRHPHLATCAVCRDRYTAFGTWMAGVAGELRDEADAMLTPERMTAQQAQIARRLEAVDRPARVIAFPKAARAVISGNSPVRRWITVAAAASLIAGFGLGQIVPLHSGSHARPVPPPPTVALTQPHPVPDTREIAPEPDPISADPISEEELLSSDRYIRAHVTLLSALDDMTPHARDTVLDRRNK